MENEQNKVIPMKIQEPNSENLETTKNTEFETLKGNLELINSFFSTENENNPLEGLTESFGALFALPDEEFELLASGILYEYERSLNNPSEKMFLAQVANSTGIRAEELAQSFEEMARGINELEGISTIKKNFFKRMVAGICNAISETEGIAKRYLRIPIELCHPEAKIPDYANLTDSGLDLYALEDYIIDPGETKLIPTGIKCALPPGYEFQVRPKSGLSLKSKMRISNTPGTIDAGYRQEIGVIIDNIEPKIKDITYTSDLVDNKPVYTITSILHGSSMHITKGQKFAQLVLSEVPKAVFYEVDSVSKIENDGRSGGFGSTGLK